MKKLSFGLALIATLAVPSFAFACNYDGFCDIDEDEVDCPDDCGGGDDDDGGGFECDEPNTSYGCVGGQCQCSEGAGSCDGSEEDCCHSCTGASGGDGDDDGGSGDDGGDDGGSGDDGGDDGGSSDDGGDDGGSGDDGGDDDGGSSDDDGGCNVSPSHAPGTTALVGLALAAAASIARRRRS